MYCLKIVIAWPDYKRPSAKCIIHHFKTKTEALKKLDECITKYISDRDLYDTEDFLDNPEDNYDPEKLISVEKFKKLISNGKLHDIIYKNFYMNQEPFEWSIFKVKCN